MELNQVDTIQPSSRISPRLEHLAQLDKLCDEFQNLPKINRPVTVKEFCSKEISLPTAEPRKLRKLIRMLERTLNESPSKKVHYPSTGRGRAHSETSNRVGPGTYASSPPADSNFTISAIPRMHEKLEHALNCNSYLAMVKKETTFPPCFNIAEWKSRNLSFKSKERYRRMEHREVRNMIHLKRKSEYASTIEAKNNRLKMYMNREMVKNAQKCWSSLVCSAAVAFVAFKIYKRKRPLKLATRKKFYILIRSIRCLGKFKKLLRKVRTRKALAVCKNLYEPFKLTLLNKIGFFKNVMKDTFETFNSAPLLPKALFYWVSCIQRAQVIWRERVRIKRIRLKALNTLWNRIVSEIQIEKEMNKAVKGRSANLSPSNVASKIISPKIQSFYISLYLQSRIDVYIKARAKFDKIKRSDPKKKVKKPFLKLYSLTQEIKDFIDKAKKAEIRSKRNKLQRFSG